MPRPPEGDGGAPLDLLPTKAHRRPLGLEALNVRERRRPRTPNEIGPHLEQLRGGFAITCRRDAQLPRGQQVTQRGRGLRSRHRPRGRV